MRVSTLLFTMFVFTFPGHKIIRACMYNYLLVCSSRFYQHTQKTWASADMIVSWYLPRNSPGIKKMRIPRCLCWRCAMLLRRPPSAVLLLLSQAVVRPRKLCCPRYYEPFKPSPLLPVYPVFNSYFPIIPLEGLSMCLLVKRVHQ